MYNNIYVLCFISKIYYIQTDIVIVIYSFSRLLYYMLYSILFCKVKVDTAGYWLVVTGHDTII